MKKILHYLLMTFVTVLLGSQLFIYADSVGVRVKPTHIEIDGTVEYQPSYASMNFYTSVPTFFNLSTTGFQIIKPWSTKASYTNISTSTATGKVTFKTDSHGTYKITMRSSNKYTEGATVYFQTVKNDTVIVNKTMKQATQGPEYIAATSSFFNLSTVGASTTARVFGTLPGSNTLVMFNNMSTNYAKALQAEDGVFIKIIESSTNSVPCFIANFTFTGIDEPKSINFGNSQYSGVAAHDVRALVYNQTFNRYTGLTPTGKDFPDSGTVSAEGMYPRTFMVPSPNRNYVSSNGQVKFRLQHNVAACSSGHFQFLDRATVISKLSSFYFEHTEIVSINDGDTIQMRIGTDTPGTEFYRYVSGLKIDKIGN